MTLASQELGPEAILVNSRKSPSEARHLGEYEVVFATDAAGELPGEISAVAGASAGAVSAPDRLSAEVADQPGKTRRSQ